MGQVEWRVLASNRPALGCSSSAPLALRTSLACCDDGNNVHRSLDLLLLLQLPCEFEKLACFRCSSLVTPKCPPAPPSPLASWER